LRAFKDRRGPIDRFPEILARAVSLGFARRRTAEIVRRRLPLGYGLQRRTRVPSVTSQKSHPLVTGGPRRSGKLHRNITIWRTVCIATLANPWLAFSNGGETGPPTCADGDRRLSMLATAINTALARERNTAKCRKRMFQTRDLRSRDISLYGRDEAMYHLAVQFIDEGKASRFCVPSF